MGAKKCAGRRTNRLINMLIEVSTNDPSHMTPDDRTPFLKCREEITQGVRVSQSVASALKDESSALTAEISESLQSHLTSGVGGGQIGRAHV